MSLTEFNAEEVIRDFKEEGREEKTVEATCGLYKNGVSVEIIAKSLNITVEKIHEILKEKVGQKV